MYSTFRALMGIESIAVKQDTNNPVSPGSVDRNEVTEVEGVGCIVVSYFPSK